VTALRRDQRPLAGDATQGGRHDMLGVGLDARPGVRECGVDEPDSGVQRGAHGRRRVFRRAVTEGERRRPEPDARDAAAGDHRVRPSRERLVHAADH
jgi:hypothetical protein